MKYVIFFLIFPILSWSSAPDCDRLKKIVDELEKKTANTFLGQQCSNLNIDEELGPYLKNENQDKSILTTQKSLIDEFKCKNLSALDLKLRSIENELTLLDGIDALKEDIKNKGEAVKQLPNKTEVQQAAKQFVESLKIASTFEKVLKTEKGRESFISSLGKQKEEDWKDVKTFTSFRNVFCEGVEEKNETICADDFKIDDGSLNELKAAIKLMKNEKRIDSSKLKSLKLALEIKKEDGSNYSFTEMLNSINLPEDGSIGPTVLNAIKKVPEFKNDDNYSFLSEIKKNKDKLSSRSFIDRFNVLISELKARHEYEIKSKLSVIFNQHSKILEDQEVATSCQSIQEIDKDQISKCLTLIKDKIPSDEASQKAALEDMLNGFSSSIDYYKSIKDKSIACDLDEVIAATGSATLPESCLALTKDKAKLMEALISLRALRNHILKEKTELLTMRNLALSKLSPTCAERRDSVIAECHDGINTYLSKEVSILSNSSSEIIAILDKSDPNNNYSQFCSGNSNQYYNNELCELLVKEPKKATKVVDSGPPIAPENASRPGFGSFMTDFAGAMSQSIQQEMLRKQLMARPIPMPQFNSPSQFSARPMSVNEKAFGSVPSLGLYQLTPGTAPGTSFHSSTSAFPISSINSTYFQGGF